MTYLQNAKIASTQALAEVVTDQHVPGNVTKVKKIKYIKALQYEYQAAGQYVTARVMKKAIKILRECK